MYNEFDKMKYYNRIYIIFKCINYWCFLEIKGFYLKNFIVYYENDINKYFKSYLIFFKRYNFFVNISKNKFIYNRKIILFN